MLTKAMCAASFGALEETFAGPSLNSYHYPPVFSNFG